MTEAALKWQCRYSCPSGGASRWDPTHLPCPAPKIALNIMQQKQTQRVWWRYWCCHLATEENSLWCGGVHSLLGENRKVGTGLSEFLTLFKWNTVTKSHVSGFQPAGLGKDLLFAFLWGTRFFPAGDMTLEVGQCLDVVLNILFLQRTVWSNWFD